jgi:hypothetical protein
MSGGVVACAPLGVATAHPDRERAMLRQVCQFLTRHHALWIALVIITEGAYRGGC